MSGLPVRDGDRFLVFGAPQIEAPEIREVVDSLEAGWLGTGPKVAQFESEFTEYVGAEHGVAVNSCTAALHLALLSLGIGEGDEVITTPLTFCASVNAIIHVGATPVLADVEPGSMNISPAAAEAAITPRTRAVMPVHFAGRPVNMDALSATAAKHDLLIIEDCAHAIEARYHGKACGTLGNAGCFSFYVTKNVTTGEGGIVTTSSQELADEIKVNALHGMSRDAWRRFSDEGFKHYRVVAPGFKYNMMDIQAALGIHQLRRVEENWRRRQRVWGAYQEAFADLPLTLPIEPEPDTRHAYHLYTILVDEAAPLSRDDMLNAMTAQGIGVGVHYLGIPDHPYYQETYGWDDSSAPVAVDIGRRTLSLPLSPALTSDDVEDVIEAVRRVLR